VTLAMTLSSFGCDVFDSTLWQDRAGHDLGTSLDASTVCGHDSRASLCTGGTVFCDGFEGENNNFSQWSGVALGTPDGMPANLATALTVDGSAVCLGNGAMHAHTVGADQQAFAFRVLQNRPSPLHVRLYFNIAQVDKAFQLLGFHTGSGDYATLYVDPANAQFLYSTSFSTTNLVFPAPAIATNRWLCMELVVRFDTTNGEVALSLNNQLLGDNNGLDTQAANHILDTVNVGIVSVDTTETGVNDLYVDEVSMSATAIGCN
jgi:hypothetical protein